MTADLLINPQRYLLERNPTVAKSKRTCPYCGGSGQEDHGDGDWRTCGACGGSGAL